MPNVTSNTFFGLDDGKNLQLLIQPHHHMYLHQASFFVYLFEETLRYGRGVVVDIFFVEI